MATKQERAISFDSLVLGNRESPAELLLGVRRRIAVLRRHLLTVANAP